MRPFPLASALAAALLASTLAACQPQAPGPGTEAAADTTTATTRADAAFDALARRWLDGWMPITRGNQLLTSRSSFLALCARGRVVLVVLRRGCDPRPQLAPREAERADRALE